MGTDVGTERSKHSDVLDWYPSLLPNQYHLPIKAEKTYEGDH
jgi:hypothetical protein